MDKSGMLNIVRHSIWAVCICTFPFPTNAHIFVGNGSLSTPDGIDGLGSWGTGLTNLTWSIDHNFPGGSTTGYTYTFEHPETNTFEFIIEIHPDMLTNELGVDFANVSSTLPNWEAGLFTPSASTPGMPDTIPGVRFWGDSGSTTETISFTSNYFAMWGDFYATDANATVAAWNTGFTNSDTDPSQPESDGSVDFHILVPGADGIPIVPTPPAVWLFGSGILGLIGIARRKKAA